MAHLNEKLHLYMYIIDPSLFPFALLQFFLLAAVLFSLIFLSYPRIGFPFRGSRFANKLARETRAVNIDVNIGRLHRILSTVGFYRWIRESGILA